MLKTRVLIIDDEIESINLLTNLIADFTEIKDVISRTNSVEGFSAIKDEEPDIVFLDLNMPKLNGIEILKLIHQFDIHIHVIIITAYSDDIKEAAKYGIIDYLLKPFHPDDLKKSIDKYRRHKLQHNTFSNNSEDIKNSINQIKISSAFEDYYFDTKEIVYLEADGNYTKIYTNNANNNQITISSYNLGKIQQKLPSHIFFRISRKTIINAHYLKKVDKKKKVCTLNIENIEIPFSKSILSKSGL